MRDLFIVAILATLGSQTPQSSPQSSLTGRWAIDVTTHGRYVGSQLLVLKDANGQLDGLATSVTNAPAGQPTFRVAGDRDGIGFGFVIFFASEPRGPVQLHSGMLQSDGTLRGSLFDGDGNVNLWTAKRMP